jgi:hypothetical protein
MIRQMVARGMKPEEVQAELRKQGITAEIVELKIQPSPASAPAPQTQSAKPSSSGGNIVDSAVKGAISIAEAATKPVTDRITDFLWSDVKQRFSDTMTPMRLEVEAKGEKPSLSQLLGAYISPVEEASRGYELRGNMLAAGVTGFAAGALTMLTAPIGIAEHVAEKGKEGGLAGLGEAAKDIVVGTVGWAAGIPGRVASGSPGEIGMVAGEVAGGILAGKAMEAPLKVPGKVYSEVRFWDKEYVPFEKIAHPAVASGKTEFTPVTVMEKGQYARPATPNEAVQATIKQFYENPTKETVEVGQKYPAIGWHGSPKATEMGKQGELEVKEGKPRIWDVPGLYVSGQAMDFFLKTKEYTSTLNPITAIKSTVQTIREEGVTGFIKEEIKHTFGLPGKEGFITVGMKGVKEVPKEFAEKGLAGYKEFFEKGPIEPGFAYVEPKTGILRQTWEHQAVIPKGALLKNVHEKGFEKFTKVEIGSRELKVPIYEMVYERIAEHRFPKSVKEVEKVKEAQKGELKPYEQVLKEYEFKERVEYRGPRTVFEKMAKEITGEFRTPKTPAYEISGVREPRMQRRGKEVFGVPEFSEIAGYKPEYAPAYRYEPILDTSMIYGTARSAGAYFGGFGRTGEITRSVLYQEGRKKEEPYKIPDIDLDFFKKFNPVGELLGGRFRL